MSGLPSNEILLERFKQTHELTKEIRHDVKEGFKTLNGRISKNTEDIHELQWQRENDEKMLKEAQREAKRIIKKAAEDARIKVVKSVETPTENYNKWLIGLLVTIIVALIGAGVFK